MPMRCTSSVLFALLVACASSSPAVDADVSLDASPDATLDGSRDASGGPPCPPLSRACCCTEDIVFDPPVCVAGRWSCEEGSIQEGYDCSYGCGAACGGSYCPDEFLCASPSTGYVPYIARGCVDDEDCVAVERELDCCGSLEVTGISREDRGRWVGNDERCRAWRDDCECAPSPTVADDGSTGDPADATVECVEGRCRTRF